MISTIYVLFRQSFAFKERESWEPGHFNRCFHHPNICVLFRKRNFSNLGFRSPRLNKAFGGSAARSCLAEADKWWLYGTLLTRPPHTLLKRPISELTPASLSSRSFPLSHVKTIWSIMKPQKAMLNYSCRQASHLKRVERNKFNFYVFPCGTRSASVQSLIFISTN